MKFWLALLSMSFAGVVYAHGPTPQKTDESIQVSMAPEVVWKKIITPCSIAQWNPEVTACDIVNDKQQRLTLKNGKKILQEVDEIANAEMTLSYRFSGEIDIAALPVSSFNGKIKVSSDGGGSKVIWTARYYRAFTGNEPPAGQDDESAKNAIDAFVKAGLNGLKDNKISSNALKNNAVKNNVASSASCCQAARQFLKRWGLSW